MANEQLLISGINHKIRRLIELYKAVKEENQELKNNVKALTQRVEALTNELEVKSNELFKITLAKTIESELGVEVGKKKLDSLIDEIDKCIEVMSD